MSFETSATTVARTTPAVVWALYADPTRRPVWEPDLTRCTLNGPFATGTRGVVHPADAPEQRFELADVVPGARFAEVTPVPHRLLPLARIEVTHELAPLGEARTRITHRVRITGPLAALVSRWRGAAFAADVPDTVARLADLAEALAPVTEDDARHAA